MKILLHVCCAPDGTVAFERLKELGEVWGYFHNPNIHPEEEYLKRLDSFMKLVREWDLNFVESEYNPREWFETVKGFENEPEGGNRCRMCIEFNLDKTAIKAKELGFDAFATSLTTSPHKDLIFINGVGKKIGEKYNLKYIESTFRKKNGFLLSVEYSKKLGLYRQNYCGCVFSIRKVEKVN
ncbi:MAG: epoxyqueuosine reductase [Thermotogaceae bacterium]|jgi:predicted adenine nucleotide alpha hydrolase (AANH) superfamily ATPase|nr:epoxyqueuosine reductase [Thermotogaceae bacterium]MDN5338391.1 epoxyqueuosine reductase [Thermotogaceae bacterium]